MRFLTRSMTAWVRCLALLGMAWAALMSTSIETLIPAMGVGIGLEALARFLLATRSERSDQQRLQALFGLAISASIFFRPSYSILTLSFILLLQLLLWLVGDGVFRLWEAREEFDQRDEVTRGSQSGTGPMKMDWLSVVSAVVAVAQIGFGIALHLWPGAGALDRGPVLAFGFLFLGVVSGVQATFGSRSDSASVSESTERPSSGREQSGP